MEINEVVKVMESWKKFVWKYRIMVLTLLRK